jgi:hypothetical protein
MKNKKFKEWAIVFYSVIVTLALGLPVMAFATPVPDTGQTKCYGNNQEIPCPSPGQPFYGQDAQYGPNLQSFTDLGNGVVRDNITGLEWQQATANYAWQQAFDYCVGLSLGGHDDWRLPTIKELSTLVDSSILVPGPTINTTYFPYTEANIYWSSITNAGSSNLAFGLYFGYGTAYGFYDKSSSNCVRAVRGGQSSNSFVDNGDGTISDSSTGLMWQKATAPGTYTWEQALLYCENLTLPVGGYSDWRLPNRNELQTLVDYSKYSPSIDTAFFPNTLASNYLSSTTHSYPDHAHAWNVEFSYGNVDHGNVKSGYAYVRAVRDVGSTGTSTISSTTTSICDADCWKAAYEQSQEQLQQCQTELQACQNQTTTTTAQPTNIKLSILEATPFNEKVNLKWKTESEPENAGFNIWRAEGFVKVNDALIPALGSALSGSEYDFVDQWVLNGKRYFYLLEDIDTNGISTFHGPVKAVPRWWK